MARNARELRNSPLLLLALRFGGYERACTFRATAKMYREQEKTVIVSRNAHLLRNRCSIVCVCVCVSSRVLTNERL